MKRVFYSIIIAGALIIGQVMPVWASCTTHTFLVNGRFTTCTTCCFGSMCNTTCF